MDYFEGFECLGMRAVKDEKSGAYCRNANLFPNLLQENIFIPRNLRVEFDFLFELVQLQLQNGIAGVGHDQSDLVVLLLQTHSGSHSLCVFRLTGLTANGQGQKPKKEEDFHKVKERKPHRIYKSVAF